MSHISAAGSQSPAVREIATIWHRIFALIIDGLILSLVGHGLGIIFWSFWFQIGPYGRFIGFPIVLLYFGIQNSEITGGQTVGKRLARIAVRGADSRPIGLGRSLLRAVILFLPFLFIGWGLPLFQVMVFRWLQLVIILGGGMMIFYSLVFNRKARQGLHDLICQTYVVNVAGFSIPAFPKTPLWILKRTIFLGFVGVVLATLFSYWLSNEQVEAQQTASTQPLYQTLNADDRFFSVRVSDDEINNQIRLLDIEVWHRGYVDPERERERLVEDIARTAFAHTENINQFDIMNISVILTYDLGIAQRNLVMSEYRSIDDWRQRVEAN